MADTDFRSMLTEQNLLGQTAHTAQESHSHLLADTFKMPDIKISDQTATNLTHAAEFTVGGAAIGTAVLMPLSRVYVAPAMGLFGGMMNGLMTGNIGKGVDMGIQAATRFGLEYGIKGGAAIGLAAFGAYKGYEFLTDKKDA